MKKLLILLSLLLVVGCSVEQDTANKPEVEVVKETSYLMCGDPLGLKKYTYGSVNKVLLIEIRKTKVFHDGVLYEGRSYGPDPETGTYFSILVFRQWELNGRIYMHSSNWVGDRPDHEDTTEYRFRDVEIYTSMGKERQSSTSYILNRETLKLEISGTSSSDHYRGKCEISSKEANQDFRKNFLAEEKHIEEKAKEKREKEKAEQLEKNKI